MSDESAPLQTLIAQLPLLQAGKLVSQRDLYYSAPGLFKGQDQCNRDIQSLCKALSVPRLALNVYASSRGFVVRRGWERSKNAMVESAPRLSSLLLLALVM